MARPLDAEKRDKYLAAALKLFVEKGVQNTTTAEIAREAGTASGTLFVYFNTKQDLIDELVLKISKEYSESVRALLEPAMSARETFLVIWNAVFQWFMDHSDAYLFNQQIRDSGIVSPSVVEKSGKDLSFFYDAITKGLVEESIRPYPPELIGGILYQDVVAVMNLIRLQPDADRQAETIRQGFEIFWNGIRKSL